MYVCLVFPGNGVTYNVVEMPHIADSIWGQLPNKIYLYFDTFHDAFLYESSLIHHPNVRNVICYTGLEMFAAYVKTTPSIHAFERQADYAHFMEGVVDVRMLATRKIAHFQTELKVISKAELTCIPESQWEALVGLEVSVKFKLHAYTVMCMDGVIAITTSAS